MTIQEIEMSDWTNTKPTCEGVYRVKGYDADDSEAYAVVEVRADSAGDLCCNLHQRNTCGFGGDWYPVKIMSDDHRWLGPLQSGHTEPFGAACKTLDDVTPQEWTQLNAERCAKGGGQ